MPLSEANHPSNQGLLVVSFCSFLKREFFLAFRKILRFQRLWRVHFIRFRCIRWLGKALMAKLNCPSIGAIHLTRGEGVLVRFFRAFYVFSLFELSFGHSDRGNRRRDFLAWAGAQVFFVASLEAHIFLCKISNFFFKNRQVVQLSQWQITKCVKSSKNVTNQLTLSIRRNSRFSRYGKIVVEGCETCMRRKPITKTNPFNMRARTSRIVDILALIDFLICTETDNNNNNNSNIFKTVGRQSKLHTSSLSLANCEPSQHHYYFSDHLCCIDIRLCIGINTIYSENTNVPR